MIDRKLIEKRRENSNKYKNEEEEMSRDKKHVIQLSFIF